MNYVLNEEKMFADVADGIAIVINSETGIYYGINELGTIVYKNLTNGASEEAVLSELKSISNAPVDLESRLGNFIRTLLELEIISEGETLEGHVKIDSEIAQKNNFVFDIKEYNDAQELLLADPIHEVKEETGWTPEKDSIGYTKEETAIREQKVEV